MLDFTKGPSIPFPAIDFSIGSTTNVMVFNPLYHTRQVTEMLKLGEEDVDDILIRGARGFRILEWSMT